VPPAWPDASDGHPTLVAVVDSGVNEADPALAGAVQDGWDFVNGGRASGDAFGHGTAVAEVIAGRATGAGGGVGVCWWCRVEPVRVLAADGGGTSDTIAAGIRFAVDHGARIINLSVVLAGPIGSVADAIAYAEQHDVLVVAAAGNDGASAPSYPAAYPGVVAVAAVDSTGGLYGWSRSGPWVTIAAPGCAVTTTTGGAPSFCGTSTAAAFVSGVAALALAADPTVSASTLSTALRATGVPTRSGLKLVDAAALLAMLSPAPAAVGPGAPTRQPTSARTHPHHARPRLTRAQRHARAVRLRAQALRLRPH
jgi:subtilisin family serine protease